MTAIPAEPGALRSSRGRRDRSRSAARPFPLARPSRRQFRFRFLAQEAREWRRRSRFRARPAGSGSAGGKQPGPAMVLPTQVLRVLCAGGGSLELEELLRRLPGRPTAEQLAAVLRDPQRFTLVRTPDEAEAGGAAAAAEETVLVVATSSLRLCLEHGAGCRGGCGRLHLCKYHLKGVCRNQQARKECKFVHDFYSPHNHSVLRQHGLDSTFSNDELRQLLLQNDPTLLPEVCLHYNKGDGPYGSCTFKKMCTKLHVCQYFLRGQCRFGSSCKRSHDFSKPECCEKLERQGMSSDIIQKLPSIYRNMYAIQNSKGSKHDTEDNKSLPCKERKHSSSQESTSTSNEVEQICLYNLYTSCIFEDKCIRTHFHLPYRWQISDGTTWKDLESTEEIEKEYCDPNNIRSSKPISESGFIFPYISFVDMQSGFKKVRRLSTASSVTKPPHFILTTEWIWYWKDEHGVWREYGKKDSDRAAATVSSDDLEKAYTVGNSAKLNFKAGVHEYELDFGAMTQKNLRYKTERKVCRRPKFVSQSEVERIRKRGFKNTEELRRIPSHWDKSALPELGFKLIELDSSSEEYNKVKGDFQRTMPKTHIKRICRIQNPSLWELYQWQKEQMQKSNGGKTDERFLFHGTSKKHIDAICHQNFDWRICGLNGTVYGKGSYFARDASYSDAYCREGSCSKTMFQARVLVGEFTVGRSSYVRPPLKDNQNFYDSCVNSSSNPSIFVIFEKQQVYPEYLIEYLDQACARML